MAAVSPVCCRCEAYVRSVYNLPAKYKKLVRSANLPDGEKTQCVLVKQEHLNCVQTERDLYKRVCQEAKTIFEEIEGRVDLDQQHGVCTLDITMHYSFDFAQQIHIPSNPMQPGPIY